MSVALQLLQHSPPNGSALRDWVLRRLYEAIFSGEFPPGLTLSENVLADRLQVSRQPIRDALRQLETDGLIEGAAGNGARRVVVFDLDNLTEIYTIRAALEGLSFRAACANITDEQLADLEHVQTDLEARLRGGAPAPGEYDAAPDFRFHQIVAEAANMPQLHAFLVNVWLKTWALLNQLQIAGTYPDAKDLQDSYRDRRRLLEALQTRDAALAERSVQEHVANRQHQLISAIESGRGRFRLPGTWTQSACPPRD